jgi:hypothetical protein
MADPQPTAADQPHGSRHEQVFGYLILDWLAEMRQHHRGDILRDIAADRPDRHPRQ